MSRAFGSATLAGLLCLWRWRCLRLTSERPHCIEERFSDDAPVAKKRLRVGGLSGRALVVLVKLTSKVKGSGGAREPRRHGKEEVRPHVALIVSTNWSGNPVPREPGAVRVTIGVSSSLPLGRLTPSSAARPRRPRVHAMTRSTCRPASRSGPSIPPEPPHLQLAGAFLSGGRGLLLRAPLRPATACPPSSPTGSPDASPPRQSSPAGPTAPRKYETQAAVLGGLSIRQTARKLGVLPSTLCWRLCQKPARGSQAVSPRNRAALRVAP